MIRPANAAEAPVLEALQRRFSEVWDEYREQLAAHPDAIELPQTFIEKGWVRVGDRRRWDANRLLSRDPDGRQSNELDGLFVEPVHMRRGVGGPLGEDAAARAPHDGAECLEVTAGPAQAFYEKLSFRLIGAAQTRFGAAVRMRRELQRRSPP